LAAEASEAHARASAILIDEFDASNFECTATAYTMLFMISPADASVPPFLEMN
jgi:hypothetical protein